MTQSRPSEFNFDHNGYYKQSISPAQESEDLLNSSKFKISTNQLIFSGTDIWLPKFNLPIDYSIVDSCTILFSVVHNINQIYCSRFNHEYKNHYTSIYLDTQLLSESKIDFLCYKTPENNNYDIIFNYSKQSSDTNSKVNIVILEYAHPDYLNIELIKSIENRLSITVEEKNFFSELYDCNLYFLQYSFPPIKKTLENKYFYSPSSLKVFQNGLNKESHEKLFERPLHPTDDIIDHSNNDLSATIKVRTSNPSTKILDASRYSENDSSEETINKFNKKSFDSQISGIDSKLSFSSNSGIYSDEMAFTKMIDKKETVYAVDKPKENIDHSVRTYNESKCSNELYTCRVHDISESNEMIKHEKFASKSLLASNKKRKIKKVNKKCEILTKNHNKDPKVIERLDANYISIKPKLLLEKEENHLKNSLNISTLPILSIELASLSEHLDKIEKLLFILNKSKIKSGKVVDDVNSDIKETNLELSDYYIEEVDMPNVLLNMYSNIKKNQKNWLDLRSELANIESRVETRKRLTVISKNSKSFTEVISGEQENSYIVAENKIINKNETEFFQITDSFHIKIEDKSVLPIENSHNFMDRGEKSNLSSLYEEKIQNQYFSEENKISQDEIEVQQIVEVDDNEVKKEIVKASEIQSNRKLDSQEIFDSLVKGFKDSKLNKDENPLGNYLRNIGLFISGMVTLTGIEFFSKYLLQSLVTAIFCKPDNSLVPDGSIIDQIIKKAGITFTCLGEVFKSENEKENAIKKLIETSSCKSSTALFSESEVNEKSNGDNIYISFTDHIAKKYAKNIQGSNFSTFFLFLGYNLNSLKSSENTEQKDEKLIVLDHAYVLYKAMNEKNITFTISPAVDKKSIELVKVFRPKPIKRKRSKKIIPSDKVINHKPISITSSSIKPKGNEDPYEKNEPNSPSLTNKLKKNISSLASSLNKFGSSVLKTIKPIPKSNHDKLILTINPQSLLSIPTASSSIFKSSQVSSIPISKPTPSLLAQKPLPKRPVSKENKLKLKIPKSSHNEEILLNQILKSEKQNIQKSRIMLSYLTHDLNTIKNSSKHKKLIENDFHQYDLIELAYEIEQLSKSQIKREINIEKIKYLKVLKSTDCIPDYNVKAFWKVNKSHMQELMKLNEAPIKLKAVVSDYIKQVIFELNFDKYYSKISELLYSSDSFTNFLSYFTFIFIDYSNILNQDKRSCVEKLLNILKKRSICPRLEDYSEDFSFTKYFFSKLKPFLSL